MSENEKDTLDDKINEKVNTETELSAESDSGSNARTDEAKEQTYQKLVRLMTSINAMVVCNDKAEIYIQVAKQFIELAGYKDSAGYAEQCKLEAKLTKKAVKKAIYKEAKAKKNKARQALDYYQAAELFLKIKGYKDADELALECDKAAKSLEKKTTRKTLITFIAIVVCFVVLVIAASTHPAKYYLANAQMAAKSYNSAINLYKKLDGYKDSKDRLIECRYQKGIKLLKDEDYQGASDAFTLAGDYKDSMEQKANAEKLIIKNSKVGDVITLGSYDWMILELNGSQAFLMIKTALPGMAYNNSSGETTWESSTLRQWLNSDFLNASFSEAEISNIILTDVINSPNAKYGTSGGNNTQDYIYLMSSDEVPKYSELFPTFKSNCWLRSPGNSPSSAAFLSVEKEVMNYGYAVDSNEIYVRPVLWFNLQ